MSMTRRTLLATAWKGSAAVAVVGSGVLGWRLHDTGMIGEDNAPFEPWAAYETLAPGDPMSLVGAAILAANPHNTQPWRFEVQAGRIDLFAVPERNLGSFDPYRREMWLGLGCAVENMVQAASAKGFAVSDAIAAPRSQANGPSDPTHAARLLLAPGEAAPSSLSAAIAQRRTHRGDYLPGRPVDADVLDALAAMPAPPDVRLVLFRAEEARGRAYAEGSVAATEWIAADATMSGDSHRWFRANPREVAEHRDGVSIPTSGLAPWLAAAGQILPQPDTSAADRYWLDSTRRQVATATGFGMIAVRGLYDRRQQIEAGRLWQRLQLTMTDAGLASQPINQMIEVVDRERQLGRPAAMAERLRAFTGDGWHATFAFRFGHAEAQVPHSPRRSVTSVVTATTRPAQPTAISPGSASARKS